MTSAAQAKDALLATIEQDEQALRGALGELEQAVLHRVNPATPVRERPKSALMVVFGAGLLLGVLTAHLPRS